MKQINRIILKTTIAVTSMTVILFILLFISAKMIEQIILDISNAELLVALAIILSVFVITFITEMKNNNSTIVLISSFVLTFFTIVLSLIIHGNNFSFPIVIKHIISVFCGTFLGLFFGKRRHYKLRYNRNKVRLTTK